MLRAFKIFHAFHRIMQFASTIDQNHRAAQVKNTIYNNSNFTKKYRTDKFSPLDIFHIINKKENCEYTQSSFNSRFLILLV